jgi:hypothetical protein
MPSVNDTIRISTALNFDFYDFEETGENYIWDFSELESIGQRVDTFMAVTETPIFYWPFFLFSADLASPLISDSPIPESPLTDVYNFYSNESDGYKDLGFAATLFSIPLPFKFESPDILYDFPMNFGDVDSSESGFNFGLDGFGNILVDRKRVNTVDGWGTLITPFGTYEVLRIKSDVTEYDSIYIDSISIGIPVHRDYTEYKWLAKGQKVPLLIVSTSLLGMVVDYVDSLSTITTNLNSHNALAGRDVIIFPNPGSDFINIKLDDSVRGKVTITFVDLQGRVISKSQQNLSYNSIIRLNLQHFLDKPGSYFMQLSGEKFAVTKRIIYKLQ